MQRVFFFKMPQENKGEVNWEHFADKITVPAFF